MLLPGPAAAPVTTTSASELSGKYEILLVKVSCWEVFHPGYINNNNNGFVCDKTIHLTALKVRWPWLRLCYCCKILREESDKSCLSIISNILSVPQKCLFLLTYIVYSFWIWIMKENPYMQLADIFFLSIICNFVSLHVLDVIRVLKSAVHTAFLLFLCMANTWVWNGGEGQLMLWPPPTS